MDHLEYHQLALVTQQKYRRERQSLLRKDKFPFSNDIPSIRFRNTLSAVGVGYLHRFENLMRLVSRLSGTDC